VKPRSEAERRGRAQSRIVFVETTPAKPHAVTASDRPKLEPFP
jgi:hypothetical protein